MTNIVSFSEVASDCDAARLALEHRALLSGFRLLDSRASCLAEADEQSRQQALADALELTLADIQTRVIQVRATSASGAMFQLFRLYSEVEQLVSLVPDSREDVAEDARVRALALIRSIGSWLAAETGIDPAAAGADYFLPKARPPTD